MTTPPPDEPAGPPTDPAVPPVPAPEQSLDERYGRAAEARASRSTFVASIVFGLVFATLVTWVGWRWTHPSISVDLTGYHVVDASSTTVDFTVHKRADRVARCVVRALDRGHVAVGRVVVEVPRGVRTRDLEVRVPTRRQAAAGEVTSCSLSRT